jgi:DNA-binding NarL/FixJ family response regulator
MSMKTLYLYSGHSSVLKHWNSGISRLYEVHSFQKPAALYRALEQKKPDAVLFDYGGKMSDIEELLLYLQGDSATKVMVFNSKPVYADGIRLVRNGARALLNAYASPNNINQAVKAVLGGNIWLYPEFIQMMIRQSTIAAAQGHDELSLLSSREREVADMVALGMSNKEIAQMADITEPTVKSHLKTVYEKLGVANRLELAILVNNVKRP